MALACSTNISRAWSKRAKDRAEEKRPHIGFPSPWQWMNTDLAVLYDEIPRDLGDSQQHLAGRRLPCDAVGRGLRQRIRDVAVTDPDVRHSVRRGPQFWQRERRFKVQPVGRVRIARRHARRCIETRFAAGRMPAQLCSGNVFSDSLNWIAFTARRRVVPSRVLSDERDLRVQPPGNRSGFARSAH